jgi:hypothetical protein
VTKTALFVKKMNKNIVIIILSFAKCSLTLAQNYLFDKSVVNFLEWICDVGERRDDFESVFPRLSPHVSEPEKSLVRLG